ncbi:MAG: histone deacetylase [Candidatus Omnitrophica bacterium]|nr:histone deacetylase [Candidatus Omnitrophota bacterium]
MATLLVYSPDYHVDLEGHVFPTAKYHKLAERLKKELRLPPPFWVESKPASREDILLVHSPKFIDKLERGSLSWDEIFTLELPFQPEVYRFFLLTVGGTILASEIAVENGIGIHLGGGFHHAFPDHGEGFCLLNDVAVAVAKLLKEGKKKRILIVDLDLHQGNGTAYIFRDEPQVFTFSMHEEENYPAHKPPGKLDVGLRGGTDDKEYCGLLKKSLGEIEKQFTPDMIFYLAGADPYKDDQLGRLDLSIEGLRQRDGIVRDFAKRLNTPVCVTLAGGYARNVEDTVTIHFNTAKMFLNMV